MQAVGEECIIVQGGSFPARQNSVRSDLDVIIASRNANLLTLEDFFVE